MIRGENHRGNHRGDSTARFVGQGISQDLWPGRSYRFGRQPDAEIRLPHHYDKVSRYHAIVEPTADETAWQVRDLGSANGTFVNDQPLEVTHQLRSGDILQLGRTGPRFVFTERAGVKASQVKASEVKSPKVKEPGAKSPEVKEPKVKSLKVKALGVKGYGVKSPKAKEPGVKGYEVKGYEVKLPEVIASEFKALKDRKPDLEVSNHKRNKNESNENLSHPENPVTLTQLFPLLSTGSQLGENPIFLLGLLTIAIGISLFVSFGKPIVFNSLLALYLSLSLYYIFIYQLCGKSKSWLLLMGMAIVTILLLRSPILDIFLWFFREVLPGAVLDFSSPRSTKRAALPFLQVISQTFWGTGLMEEILKALPILLWVPLSQQFPKAWRKTWGLEDPLDGILLCTASALGFTLLETLGQYVPQITQQISGVGSIEAGQLAGLQLLIPRVLGSIAGHLAYSGYFGYFIGLACLRPYTWIQQLGLLLLGCLSAAILHTLWNLAGLLSPIFLAISGIFSYSLLMAAILKARTFQPSNSDRD